MKYQIKESKDLLEREIEHILQLWDVSAWSTMKPDYFRTFFKDSEFHFLLDTDENILAVIRLNFDFTLDLNAAIRAHAGQGREMFGRPVIGW